MARIKGMINVGSNNYEVKVGRPMDARASVPVQADLYLEESWTKLAIYNGMIVSVIATGEIFVLRDKANFTLTESWKKLLQEGDVVESEGSGLEQEILDELPETGVENTLYFIKSEESDKNAYFEYMWINGQWELIGGTPIDMSAYYTKSEVDELIANKADKSEVTTLSDSKADKTYVDEKVLEVSNKVDALEIPSIEGLATTAQVEQVRSEIPVVEGKYTPVADFNALNERVNGIIVPETGHLATKEELATVEGKIPTDYAKKSDLNNYYDKSTVDQKLAEVAAGGEINLDGYAVKAEVEAELAKKADQSAVDASVTELRGSIHSVSEGLASKAPLTTTDALNTRITEVAESVAAVDEKVDALRIPDESKLATKEEVSAVDEKVKALDFTPYAKTADVELALADKLESKDLAPYAKSEDVNAALDEKADASELSKYATTTKVGEVESEVDAVTADVAVIKKDYVTTTSATQIAESAATAAIVGLVEAEDIPGLVSANIPADVVRDGDIADMATKAHVSATYLSQENATATYVTKEVYNSFISGAATDAEVTSAVNTAKAELSGRIDDLETASATHITKDVANLTNYMKSSEISSTYATKTELNEIADIFVGSDGENVSLSDYATTKYVDAEISEHRSETYTKTETDGKIAAAVASDKVAVLDSSGKIDDDVLPNVVTTAITWGTI